MEAAPLLGNPQWNKKAGTPFCCVLNLHSLPHWNELEETVQATINVVKVKSYVGPSVRRAGSFCFGVWEIPAMEDTGSI